MLVLLLAAVALALPQTQEEIEVGFRSFKREFNKTYETQEIEQEKFAVFKHNLLKAHKLNQLEDDEIFGITKYSDWTLEEFQVLLGFNRTASNRFMDSITVREPTITDVPSAYDWRDHGAVTAVKDQGQCGSCWAFSATEEIESRWILAGNDEIEFSPQQITSCDKTDLGCNGGDTLTAYQYVEGAGGMTTEKKYPYTSGDSGRSGFCEDDKIKIAGGDVKSMEWATHQCKYGGCSHQDEDTLKKNLADKGPVSICVNAERWQSYKRGVMSPKSCGGHTARDLDHCVQLVGYTEDYWIVRNSWNTDWGIDGYIHLSVGDNTCGVANEATITDF